jgi:hypothetical protein
MSIYSFPFIHFLFSSKIVKLDGFYLASSTDNSFLEILSLCYGIHKFHMLDLGKILLFTCLFYS